MISLLCAAAGPSLDADVGTVERAAPAEEPESKLDVLTAAHGTTRDTAQRYLMAANDDLPAAHRLLQASRVRASSGSLSPLLPGAANFGSSCCSPSVGDLALQL